MNEHRHYMAQRGAITFGIIFCLIGLALGYQVLSEHLRSGLWAVAWSSSSGYTYGSPLVAAGAPIRGPYHRLVDDRERDPCANRIR